MLKIVKTSNKEKAKEIFTAVQKNGGHCPCRIKKDDTTRCMCEEFRKQETPGPCHCGLYEKIEVEN